MEIYLKKKNKNYFKTILLLHQKTWDAHHVHIVLTSSSSLFEIIEKYDYFGYIFRFFFFFIIR